MARVAPLLKILHFNSYGSSVGGAEDYIREVASALADAGHSSHLIYFESSEGASLLANAACIPLAPWPETPDEAIDGIEKAIAAFQPDVAYVHTVLHPDLLGWLGRRLPTVAYVHAPYPVCPGSAQYLRRSSRVCHHTAGAICLLNAEIERCCWGRNPLKHIRLLARSRSFIAAYRSLDVILVGSDYMRHLLIRGGVRPGAISILSPVLRPLTLPYVPYPKDSRTLLFAGRLVPEKGLAFLIRALASVQGDWELIVAGEGEDRVPCARMCTELGLTHRVRFAGRLSPEELEASYEACAFVVVPSLWPEPYGRIGPEALLRGRPVVAFATGGIPDWLEHGTDGYLVPAGDISRLAFSIQELLDKPELRTEMGRHGREKAIAAWDPSTHVKRLVNVLEGAAGRQRFVPVGALEDQRQEQGSGKRSRLDHGNFLR